MSGLEVLTAIFTGLLAFVGFIQVLILWKQTEIQRLLQERETQGLVFLEVNLTKKLHEPIELAVANLGRYGCLVWEIAVLVPKKGWEVWFSSPRENVSEAGGMMRIVVASGIPVMPGERKVFRKVYSLRQILPNEVQLLWPYLAQEGKVSLEVAYTHGGEPEVVRHDFFELKFSNDNRGDYIVESVSLKKRTIYRA